MLSSVSRVYTYNIYAIIYAKLNICIKILVCIVSQCYFILIDRKTTYAAIKKAEFGYVLRKESLAICFVNVVRCG